MRGGVGRFAQGKELHNGVQAFTTGAAGRPAVKYGILGKNLGKQTLIGVVDGVVTKRLQLLNIDNVFAI